MLEMKYSASWPVDVLWRRKSSGNPFQNGKSVESRDREERQTPRQTMKVKVQEKSAKQDNAHVPQNTLARADQNRSVKQ
jgi:hypothetical protein